MEQAQSASVVVVAGDTGAPLAKAQHLQLAGKAPAAFLEAARNAAKYKADRFVPFVFGYTPEAHESLIISLQDYPEIADPIAALAKVGTLPLFQADRQFIDQFKAFATIVGHDGERAVFLRRAGPKQELGRTKSIALLFDNGTFNTVEDKLFLFDQDVDLIAWKGVAYVLRSAVLQALFPAFTVVKEKVDQALKDVAPLVGNFEQFTDAVNTQPQMRSKLMGIAQRPYLAKLRIEDLKAQIARKMLAVQVTKSPDGREVLVFDPSPAGRWLILKLLDDDYLDSTMTREQYEVNSKARTGGAGSSTTAG
jgi:hypothetical protein